MKLEINPENSKRQFNIHLSRAVANLKGAKLLFKGKNYNSAVSRAYYAFFEAAHAVLITKGITAKTHAGVLTLFGLHFVKTKQIPAKFAKFFREAKQAREEADYQFLKKFTKEETERVVTTAEEFIKVIEEKFGRSSD